MDGLPEFETEEAFINWLIETINTEDIGDEADYFIRRLVDHIDLIKADLDELMNRHDQQSKRNRRYVAERDEARKWACHLLRLIRELQVLL